LDGRGRRRWQQVAVKKWSDSLTGRLAPAAAALLFWASRHASKTSGLPVSGSGRIGTMELTLGLGQGGSSSASEQTCSSCQRTTREVGAALTELVMRRWDKAGVNWQPTSVRTSGSGLPGGLWGGFGFGGEIRRPNPAFSNREPAQPPSPLAEGGIRRGPS
jgi:hypothetical protein